MKEFGVGSVMSCETNLAWGYRTVSGLHVDTNRVGDKNLYNYIDLVIWRSVNHLRKDLK